MRDQLELVPGIHLSRAFQWDRTSEYGVVLLFADDLNECRKLKYLIVDRLVLKELSESISESFAASIVYSSFSHHCNAMLSYNH